MERHVTDWLRIALERGVGNTSEKGTTKGQCAAATPFSRLCLL